MKAQILVWPKGGIPDYIGQELTHRLGEAGHNEIITARVGKIIELDLHGLDQAGAKTYVDSLCQRVLVNSQTEEFQVLSIVDR